MKRLSGIFYLITIFSVFSLISTCLVTPAYSALFEDEEEEEAKTKTKTNAIELATGTQPDFKLGKEVMDKVNKSYYRLWRSIISFDASYIVEKDGVKVGKLTVHWEDGKDVKAKFDGDVGKEDLNTILNLHLNETFGYALFRDYKTQKIAAKKKGGDYILTSYAGGEADAENSYWIVNKNYQMIKNVNKDPEGDMEIAYQVETQDGLHYIKTSEWKLISPGGDMTCKYDITYKREKGKAIINKIDASMKYSSEDFEGDTVEEIKLLIKLDPEKKVTMKDVPTATTEGEEETVEEGEEIEIAGGEGELPPGWDDITKQVILHG